MRELPSLGRGFQPIRAGFVRSRSLGLALLAASACLFPLAGRGAEVAAAPTNTLVAPTNTLAVPAVSVAALSAEKPASYSGRVRVEYDYRSLGDEHNSNLYGSWSAAGHNLQQGLADFYFSGRMRQGLEDSATFHGLNDGAGVTESRILQGYLDVHDKPDDLKLRLGRQYVDVADYLTIDGAQAILFENRDLGGRVYVGAPVSYYATEASTVALGASLVGTPWEGNRTRFTYAQYGGNSEESGCDRNYFADMRQQLITGVQARGRLAVLNDQFRNGSLDLSGMTPDGDTSLFVGGSRWGECDASTRAYSPLAQLLGKEDPYSMYYARLSQAITRTVSLSPGVSYRLADGGGNGPDDFSNRSYSDYDLTLMYDPNRVLSSSLSLQYWDVSGGDKFVGLSGEVTYRKPKVWEIGAGCEYAAYSYNYNTDFTYIADGGHAKIGPDGTSETSPYAVTYFVRAKWSVTRCLTLRAQCDLENDKALSALGVWARASAEVKF